MDKYDLGIIRSDLNEAFVSLKALETYSASLRTNLQNAASVMAGMRGQEADKAWADISAARTLTGFVDVRAASLRTELTHISDRLDSTQNGEGVA